MTDPLDSDHDNLCTIFIIYNFSKPGFAVKINLKIRQKFVSTISLSTDLDSCPLCS